MNRLRRVLTTATFAAALLISACGTSASAGLAKDLIPVPALQAAPWNLRPAASGRTLLPFGTDQAGAPLGTTGFPAPSAAATRQWLHGSGGLAARTTRRRDLHGH